MRFDSFKKKSLADFSLIELKIANDKQDIKDWFKKYISEFIHRTNFYIIPKMMWDFHINHKNIIFEIYCCK